jgi:hypothetical protein
MNFTLEELETIKNALICSLESPNIEDEVAVIKILDRIDNENDLD